MAEDCSSVEIAEHYSNVVVISKTHPRRALCVRITYLIAGRGPYDINMRHTLSVCISQY
jgi:hypothetical protein